MDQPSPGEAGSQLTGAFPQRREPPQDLPGGGHADIVLGEIDAGFEQRDQLQELFLERREAAREGPFHLARGHTRLVQRGGFNQVAHGFGLG